MTTPAIDKTARFVVTAILNAHPPGSQRQVDQLGAAVEKLLIRYVCAVGRVHDQNEARQAEARRLLGGH
jgi:hypothetical protein